MNAITEARKDIIPNHEEAKSACSYQKSHFLSPEKTEQILRRKWTIMLLQLFGGLWWCFKQRLTILPFSCAAGVHRPLKPKITYHDRLHQWKCISSKVIFFAESWSTCTVSWRIWCILNPEMKTMMTGKAIQ